MALNGKAPVQILHPNKPLFHFPPVVSECTWFVDVYNVHRDKLDDNVVVQKRDTSGSYLGTIANKFIIVCYNLTNKKIKIKVYATLFGNFSFYFLSVSICNL